MSEYRTVRVPLTDPEMEERGEALASLTVKLGEQDAALAGDGDNWKDAKKAHEAGIANTRREMAQLARQMEARAEEREVECLWYAAPQLGWKFLVRMDTDEAIEQRPLTDDERQTKLDGSQLPEALPEQAAAWATQCSGGQGEEDDTVLATDDAATEGQAAQLPRGT